MTLHGDAAAQAAHDAVVPATDEDWATEYLSMDMAVRVVDDLPAALDHIARWGSGHSEAIVADSASAIADFVAGWTPPPCWSTPRPGSPTAASSASAPRSASPPRSCTPAARWACRS